ncbi:MAG: ATP-binding protein [Candidatus Pacearchaeota archaeon]|nr:ATP-binding protein [Candidatus Pacearchaeota archaeon]
MEDRIRQLLSSTPDLKGREIAKRLGLERKKVNSFLNKNRDKFQQDDEYCWRVINNSEVVIEFHDGWIDSYAFEQTLLPYPDLFSMQEKTIKFVIPKGCKLLLISIAKFLSLVNQLSDHGNKVVVDLSDCANTRTYFNRTGFFDHLGNSITVVPDRPAESWAELYKGNSDAVVEFGSVDPTQSNKTLINQLVDCFVSQSSDAFEGAASTVFGELINNIKDHSESRIEGFAALQKYGGRRPHIQTVISDSGLGIAATLKPSIEAHHPHLFRYSGHDNYDIKIVTEVMTRGEISRYGAGRGLGFKSSREQAMKFSARLSIRQENFALELVYNNGQLVNTETHTRLTAIRGTHLCFDFFID